MDQRLTRSDQCDSPFYAGRRCLVAGGTGFVGSHFADALLERGAHVRVTRHRRQLVRPDSRIEEVSADLGRKEDCIAAMTGVDTLIHAAGSVGAAGVGPADILLGVGSYVQITANLLWAAAVCGVERVLLFSSSTGYPVADHPVREEEFWEGGVHPSYEGYGWMRRYVERLAMFSASRSALHPVIIRPGAIYGPRDNFDPTSSHVIPALIRRAEARETPFRVWGSGEEMRDFLHVRDLVRGSLLALERGASCDPFNIAYGEAITVRELVREVLAACGYESAHLRFDISAPTTIPRREIDISKARRLLKFEPRINLAEGLAETVAWFRQVRGN